MDTQFDETNISVKHLSTRQLKALYNAHKEADPLSHTPFGSTPLMAAIQTELEDRAFASKVRGEARFNMDNPYIKWGVTGGGIVLGMLLISNLFYRPVPQQYPGYGTNQINISR